MCPALHMQRVIDCVYDEREVYQNISDPVTTNTSRLILEREWHVYNEMGEILSIISVSTALQGKKTQNTALRGHHHFVGGKLHSLYMETVLCA